MGDEDNNVTDLAGAAGEAIEGLEGEQMQIEEANYAQVKFVGMSWETPEVPGLKEEVAFEVHGTVVGHGEEVMHDGSVRPFAKVKVQTITRDK